MRAPISASGLRMRSIGRREREASPISVNRALLRRQQPGDHAHRRAGVAAIQRLAVGVTRPPTPVISTGPSSSLLHARAQRLHAGKRRSAIRAGGEIAEARSAFGKRGQHAVAVADGLVAGQAKAAEDILAAGRIRRSCVAVCKVAPIVLQLQV